jgi:hypothetical protein
VWIGTERPIARRRLANVDAGRLIPEDERWNHNIRYFDVLLAAVRRVPGVRSMWVADPSWWGSGHQTRSGWPRFGTERHQAGSRQGCSRWTMLMPDCVSS